MSDNELQKYVVKSILSTKAAVVGPSGKLLMLRRSSTHPQHAGEWDLIGGLWDKNDQLEESLNRESLEETGLSLDEIALFNVLLFERSGGYETYVSILYTATTKSEEVKLSYEHDEYRWITAHELDAYAMRPHWRMTAEAALRRFNS